MARNRIFRQRSAWARVLRDTAAIIDHGIAILTLALFLCLVAGLTLAADQGLPAQQPAGAPDHAKCCGKFNREAGCFPVYLRPDSASSMRRVES